jgi:hypothetical protein
VSAIAEWYLLPNHRIPDLTAACQPRKRSWLRKPERDFAAFWDFLGANATSGSGLDASGWVMSPLLVYLEEELAVPVDASVEHPVAKVIAMDTIQVIDPSVSGVWLKALDSALADLGALEAYLVEWYGDAQPLDRPGFELHVEALRYLREGVSRLTPESVLLLSIG